MMINLVFCSALETVYARESIKGFGARYDAVVHHYGGREHVGIVQLILSSRNTKKGVKAVIVKRLKNVVAHPDNMRVLQKFHHRRLVFDCTINDMTFDCVQPIALYRIAHVVPDYYDITERYTISTRPHEINLL